MKLIIDISEGIYKNIDSIQNGSIGSKQIIKKVKNGTPLDDVLDKIRAEIEQTVENEINEDKKWAIGLKYSLQIIDKYREGEES